MKLNTKSLYLETTHEGARAARISAAQQLQRSVMCCLLWEDSFYEDGQSIADRIAALVPQVTGEFVRALAIEARNEMKLRHVPLLLCREMAKHSHQRAFVSSTLEQVIQRPDELTEFLAIYSQGRTGRKTLNKLSAQVKKGLARAFGKFDEYALAKYNQQNAIKLRDVLFLCHAKPKDAAQFQLWRRLINDELQTPDTWEVELSASTDKKASWTRLLMEDKLGALALLRNLRNMSLAGVEEGLIAFALQNMKTDRVLPFRFISAARYAPGLEPQLEVAMLRCLASQEKLPGKTIIVVDNSGSMSEKVSSKSELTRQDAASAVAILLREICEKVAVVAFSTQPHIIPARRGFALRDAIQASPSGGTNTDLALAMAEKSGYDRIIVITDEQSHQTIRAPRTKLAYFVNVATEKNGIGYGAWKHIDGWSESIVRYIQALEEDLGPESFEQ